MTRDRGGRQGGVVSTGRARDAGAVEKIYILVAQRGTRGGAWGEYVLRTAWGFPYLPPLLKKEKKYTQGDRFPHSLAALRGGIIGA